MQPLITLTTDFGVQTQGIGTMEGVIFGIAPSARVIHLMHGIEAFNVRAAARTLEAVRYIPRGFHVCVCDPGVGTSRRAVALETRRGDYLIGPDNGVLLPAATILGGIERAHELTNPQYMLQPVSPIFHGRDIFSTAAAHLANGVALESFGPAIDPRSLVAAPYEDATVTSGEIKAEVIQINHFGSIHLNVLHEQWDGCNFLLGSELRVELPTTALTLKVARTFGDVSPGDALIMRDDYGRVEMARNLASFVEAYPVKIGDPVRIVRS